MQLIERKVGKSGKRVWYAHYYVIRPDGSRQLRRETTGVLCTGKEGSRPWRESRKLAEQRAMQLATVAQHEQGRPARPSSATLEQAVSALVAQMELAQRRPQSVKAVVHRLPHLFAYFGPDRDVRELTADDLRDYAVAARQSRAPGSVDKEIKALRGGMRAVGIDPPAKPDLGRVYTPRERFLEPTELAALLRAADARVARAGMGEPKRDYLVMHVYMGLTYSELYRITVVDIDWAGNQVFVRGTKAESRARAIPMSPEVRDLLQRRVAERGDPLFAPWSNTNMARDLHQMCKKAGIAPVSANDLRRTFATWMARAGVPILHLAKLMGHASTAMLEKVYARVERGQHMHDAISRGLPRLEE